MLQHILPGWLADSGEGPSGLLWLIITAVVLISQIVKANKKPATPASPDTKPEPSLSADPAEELQRFLQGLSGNSRPPAPPKPPPVPGNKSHRGPTSGGTQRTATRRAYAKVKPVATKPATPIRTVTRTPVVRTVSIHADAWEKPDKPIFHHLKHSDNYEQKEDTQAASVQHLRQGIGNDLIGKAHLRKAMVLKEILGPPLAMRSPASGT